MSLTLHGIRYSPWTLRARWALEHHKLLYHYKEHVVWLGEPGLRMESGRLRGDLTVPLLIEKGTPKNVKKTVLMDSFAIAHFADERGSGEKLIEGVRPEELAEIVADCEALCDFFRARFSSVILSDPDLQLEMLPRWVPSSVRRMTLPMVQFATRYVQKSFAVERILPEERLHEARGALNRLRYKLVGSQFSYLIGGRFSYADIVASSALIGIQPEPGKKFSPRLQEALTHEEFARDFADLLQWRDRVAAKHRPIRPSKN